jgi:putative ubiquitin-RnfH superfamily antitoxin RatB of RatAB toxin-antitoxin module
MSEAPGVEAAAAAMIGVETVVQTDLENPPPSAYPGTFPSAPPGAAAEAAAGAGPSWTLARQSHRVPAGTSVRALLCRAGFEPVVRRIEAGTLGLACHGRRAWLDDILRDGDRIEVVAPISADAKSARVERVALDRARRRSGPGTAP